MKDLGKYDKVQQEEEVEELYAEEEMETFNAIDVTDKSRSRQLLLVYLIFLGEA